MFRCALIPALLIESSTNRREFDEERCLRLPLRHSGTSSSVGAYRGQRQPAVGIRLR